MIPGQRSMSIKQGFLTLNPEAGMHSMPADQHYLSRKTNVDVNDENDIR